MKAAVYYGKHKVEIAEVLVPEIGDDDVLIKVAACGVCGTDIHIFNGDGGFKKPPTGVVLGHEFAGTVEKVGKLVNGIKVGDRVCVDPNVLCGKCDGCRSGAGHFCSDIVGIGTTVNGGFAEYCAVPQSQVYKISDGTSFEKAAMSEPVACCLHGIDMCNIKCGDTVAIIGGGMIGLIMVQLAKLSGAAKIALIEPVAEKRDLGKKLGADVCIDPMSQEVESECKKLGRIACVIECVGSISTMQQAIRIAGYRGTVMLFGLTAPDDEMVVKPHEVFDRDLIIAPSFINPYTQGRAVALIDSGKIDVSSPVYKILKLNELPALLADAQALKCGKYIIDPR